MSNAAEIATNVIRTVEMLSERIAERVDQAHVRPESWLDEEARAGIIRGAAREVLVDYLLGKGPVVGG